MVQLDPPVTDGEPRPIPEPAPEPAPPVYLGTAPIGAGSPWLVDADRDSEPEPAPTDLSDPAAATEEP